MNLRLRFALLFSFFVFVILMASVTSIYFLYEEFRKDEFFERVKERAVIHASKFFSSKKPDLNPSDSIFSNSPSSGIFAEKATFFDKGYHLLFSTPDSINIDISPGLLQKAREEGFYLFSKNFRETVVYFVNINGIQGYVVTSAYDRFGRRKIKNLKVILSFTVLGGLVLSGLFAFFYVKQIIKPLGDLTNQMQRITESNMDERLVVHENNKELGRIARNFNHMLDRLENAFEMRKRFVQHASHELRTPLTSMLAQTEAAINKNLSPQESKAIFHSLKEDQQHLIELTNSLLLLSKYEKLPLVSDLAKVRIDELLYVAIDSIKILYPDCLISLNFTTMPESERLLTVMGNEVLLLSALQNLIKNACHYSDDKKVDINIDASVHSIKITFDNWGKQLNEDETERLFIPFFRGENSQHKKGFGLGLSIVQRIIHLHKGTVTYSAINHNINRFTVVFAGLAVKKIKGKS